MGTKPINTWEEIVSAARTLTDGGADGVDRVDAFMLAAAVIYFDAAIKDGGTKLPASWKPFAAHAAGYEKTGDVTVPASADTRRGTP